MDHFWHFWITFVKCKRSSLRSQCWKRLFLSDFQTTWELQYNLLKTYIIRSLVKLQSEELQVHAEELSKVWRQLDEERETRVALKEHLVSITSDFKVQLWIFKISIQCGFKSSLFQTEQRHGNNQPEVEKRIVQVLGKLTSVVASLHPQKMREKMENFIKEANTQMLGNVRQNVLVEMREEANNRRSKEDSCQKGSLASTSY